MTQCFKKDFKVMEMCGVYKVGDNDLRLRWNEKKSIMKNTMKKNIEDKEQVQ